MSETTNTTGVTKWVYAVIVLVAIIGLLAGLLLSKATTPAPEIATATSQTEMAQQVEPATNPDRAPATAPPTRDATQNDIRRILRNVSRERRREILDQASKNLNFADDERPRVLMQKRRDARQKAMELTKADTLDVDALSNALNEVHAINGQIAEQGTKLTLEVLKLMTVEERKAATGRKPFKTRRQRIKERRQERREKRRERQQE